jgi:hypothetical protein
LPLNTVTDDRIEQHQRKDEQTLPPEHEGQTRTRRSRLLDGDGEGNHVGPERDRERAKGRREYQRHHVERQAIATRADADGKHNCRHDADRRENEQIRPLQPAADDAKIHRQSISEDDDQEDEERNR